MQHFLQRQRRWLYLLNLFTYAAHVWRLTMLDACGLPSLQPVCEWVCVCGSANFSITKQQALSPAQHNRGNQGKPVYIFDLSARWASAMQTSARRQQAQSHTHTHTSTSWLTNTRTLRRIQWHTTCLAQCAENAAPLVLISPATNSQQTESEKWKWKRM